MDRRLKIDCDLGGKNFREFGDAEELQDARCDVGKFENAEALSDCGGLEADECAETRTVEMFHPAEVDHDFAAFGEKRLDRFAEFVGCISYKLSVALHRFDFIPELIVPGVFDFTAQLIVRCHFWVPFWSNTRGRIASGVRGSVNGRLQRQAHWSGEAVIWRRILDD
jgi:hypothetical protein